MNSPNESQNTNGSNYNVEDIRDWKYRQLLDEFNRERSAAMRVGQEAPLLKLTVEKDKPCPCARQLDKIRINPVAPLDQQAGRLPPFPQCPHRCSFCHLTPTEYTPKGPGIVSLFASSLGRSVAYLIKTAVLLALLGGLGYALWLYQPWKSLPEDVDIPVVSDYLNSEKKPKDSSDESKQPADDAEKVEEKNAEAESEAESVAEPSALKAEEETPTEAPAAEENETADKEETVKDSDDAESEIPKGYRVWTDENGNQIVGKFLQYQIGKAFIQEYKTEEIVKIPLKALTDDDKEYIKPLIQKKRDK